MKKKILIASLFATFMLLVPMTSVVGLSDVEDDCGCREIDNIRLVRLKKQLNRLEVYTKLLLVLFKHNPELRELGEKLSNQVSTLIKFDLKEQICDWLLKMRDDYWNMFEFYLNLGKECWENNLKFFSYLFNTISTLYGSLSSVCRQIYKDLDCENIF